MIPQTLNDWSLDILRNLLTNGIFENEKFDFKQSLPNNRDAPGKERLRKSCAAFANSDGGFFVFGVADDKTREPDQRIIGVPNSLDLPEHFGALVAKCNPSVFWQFKNPPIHLVNGQLIHVVHIPKSWTAPHALLSDEGALIFPKRTNKGNEMMSMEEVRFTFLGYYEKRLKLELLRAELLSIRACAMSLIVPEGERSSNYSLMTFDTNILELTVADTYSITG